MHTQWRFRFAWMILAVIAVTGLVWQALVNSGLEQRIASLEEKEFRRQSIRSENRSPAIAIPEKAAALLPPIAHPPETRSGTFQSADTLRNRGMHDAESTLESMYWAINAGESNNLATLIEIPTATREAARQFYDHLPVDSRAKHSMEEIMGLWLTGGIEPISGFTVLSSVEGADIQSFDPSLKGDSSYRTVRLWVQWGGANPRANEQRFVFHNSGQGWRWVMTPELVSRVARFASSYTPTTTRPNP